MQGENVALFTYLLRLNYHIYALFTEAKLSYISTPGASVDTAHLDSLKRKRNACAAPKWRIV